MELYKFIVSERNFLTHKCSFFMIDIRHSIVRVGWIINWMLTESYVIDTRIVLNKKSIWYSKDKNLFAFKAKNICQAFHTFPSFFLLSLSLLPWFKCFSKPSSLSQASAFNSTPLVTLSRLALFPQFHNVSCCDFFLCVALPFCLWGIRSSFSISVLFIFLRRK